MINRKAIGYITANYSSTYGSVLLKDRPIASVPFLGRYRLIDFPLSNMMNAGIKTVGVVMPGNYRSLIDHVGSGKDWGLDRKKGGLFMVPGNAYGTTKGGMRFLLRDIISNKTLFQRSDKPYVVMMGTNIIFNMDLNTIIEAHENSGAQMTVVYCKATRNVDDETKLEINENGRLTGVSAGVVYGDNASMDCCIVNRETLLEIIDHYQAADYLDLLEALQGDFGNIDVCSYEYKGEVVGVFSEKSLYRRSMDLLDQTVADQLFDPDPDQGSRRSDFALCDRQPRVQLDHLGRLHHQGHRAQLDPIARRRGRGRRLGDQLDHQPELHHQERRPRRERHSGQEQRGSHQHRASRHAREHPGAGQGSVNFRYHHRALTLAPQHRS